MSSRVNYKYEEQDLSERSYNREEYYGRSSSPYRLMDEPSGEFSFKQISQSGQQVSQRSCSQYKSQSITSLRQNLQLLPKSQVIELLIQQINFSQLNPSQRQRLNDTLKEINKPKQNICTKNQESNYKKQYDDLVRDFQEYINNTRQAQQHYVKIIQDLKRQNKTLENQLNKKSKDSQHSSNYSPQSHSQKSVLMVEKLQQSVKNYIKINNQLLGKIQKLQRLNKQNSQETNKLKQENCFLKEDNEFLIKENQKLKKQNISFKSIVDELKDYIMERREAKENVRTNSNTQRSNISQNGEIRQNQNNYEMQKYTEDSIINSSQIKRREQTLNDSTILFEKDSHNIQYKDRQQNRYQKTQQNQYIEGELEVYLKTSETLKMLQSQNKMLKITNQKLQNLLQKKGQKIKILLEQVQTLKTQANIVNQEIVDLKWKIKNNQGLSHKEPTASRSTNNSDSKYSLNEAFVKRYSQCTESQFRRKQDINNIQVQQQNKQDQNRYRKAFNLESFNVLKEKNEQKQTIQQKQVQKSPQNYYIPKTLIVSNKKF